MTILEVVAFLVGAALGWVSGALKAQLHSLPRPQASLKAGHDGQDGRAVELATQRTTGPSGDERQPHAARQAA